MAGRLFPIALATLFGIATGYATFNSEFKNQRRKTLEEEYRRDVEALEGPSSKKHLPVQDVLDKAPRPAQVNQSAQAEPTGLFSTLGFWAWKNKDSPEVAPEPKQQESSTSTEPHQPR